MGICQPCLRTRDGNLTNIALLSHARNIWNIHDINDVRHISTILNHHYVHVRFSLPPTLDCRWSLCRSTIIRASNGVVWCWIRHDISFPCRRRGVVTCVRRSTFLWIFFYMTNRHPIKRALPCIKMFLFWWLSQKNWGKSINVGQFHGIILNNHWILGTLVSDSWATTEKYGSEILRIPSGSCHASTGFDGMRVSTGIHGI